MPHINLKLTFLEAVELSAVTDNGYGDGDYYKEMSQKDHATFRRAQEKLLKAIQNYNEEGKHGTNKKERQRNDSTGNIYSHGGGKVSEKESRRKIPKNCACKTRI